MEVVINLTSISTFYRTSVLWSHSRCTSAIIVDRPVGSGELHVLVGKSASREAYLNLYQDHEVAWFDLFLISLELFGFAIQCASTYSILLMYKSLSLMTEVDRAVEKYRILNLSCRYHLLLLKGKHSTLLFFFLWWSLYQPFLDVVEYSY